MMTESEIVSETESENNEFLRHYWQRNFNFSYFKRDKTIFQLGLPDTIIIIRNHEESSCPLVEYINVVNMKDWKQGNSLLCPENNYMNAQIVSCNHGYIFALGGVDALKNKPTTYVKVLDFTGMQSNKLWIELNPLSDCRINFVACVGIQYDNSLLKHNIPEFCPEIMLFAIGGTDPNGKHMKSFEILYTHDENNHRTIKMRTARTCHSAVYHKGYLYVIGGKDHKDKILNTIDRFAIIKQINNLEFQTRFPKCLHLYDTCTVVLDDKLYVIGGHNDKYEVSSKILEYDLEKQKWSTDIWSLARGRRKGSVVAIKNALYVFGGYDQNNKPILETEKLIIGSDKKLSISKSFFSLKFPYVGQNPIVFPEKLFSATKMQLHSS